MVGQALPLRESRREGTQSGGAGGGPCTTVEEWTKTVGRVDVHADGSLFGVGTGIGIGVGGGGWGGVVPAEAGFER